jgi:plastocyanin
MMAAVACRRSLPVLLFAVLAPPAMATDASVTFQCCAYTPSSVRIAPGEQVSIAPAPGVTFADHPLHFADGLGNTLSGTAPAVRSFPQDGVYQWYCGIHGHFDGVNVSGMSGRVAVTLNRLPVARFTASADSVASGAEVTFDANGSDDADFGVGQTLNYSWDLDGDGADDPGQTSPTPSMVFTNTGNAPRTVTVRLTATDTNSDGVGPESATATKVITVAAAGSPPPPGGGGTVIPPPDAKPPVVRLSLAKRTLTVGRRLRVPFTTDEPASATATLKVGRRTARASRDFAAAGRHALTLRLPRALRRLLRRRRAVTLTLVVTDAAGNGTTLRRTLRLKA